MKATASAARATARATATATRPSAAGVIIAALSLALLGFAALAALPTTPASATERPASGATITRTAHVAFENCNAQHITLSVTAPKRAFTPTQPVTVTVRLRNAGSTTCGTTPTLHVPGAHHTLTVGPCGPLSLTVRTAHGVAVYPGPVVFHCPEETGFALGPGTTARTTASWNQVEAPSRPHLSCNRRNSNRLLPAPIGSPWAGP
jgi:hypothetical protein